MESYERLIGQPCLLIKFNFSPKWGGFVMWDWFCDRIDAVLLLELLDVIPNRLCLKQDHPNCDFVGRIVSVGQVVGGSVFAASLIKITDNVYGCSKTPFHFLSDSEIYVLVELNGSDQSLCLRIIHGSFSNCHD